ncbi:hypothetical protein [Mycobacterium sp. DL440]|uniref:hypothetical protein n=1 Tax=Mycobacterium sp. DL440 TaxID=2675523 RepID=UPI00142191C1|nr:hypothetical protein [Mycobacterium sp. DL440]
MNVVTDGDIISYQDGTWEVIKCDGLMVRLQNTVDGTMMLIAAAVLLADDTFAAADDPAGSQQDQHLVAALSTSRRRDAEFWYDQMYELTYGITPAQRGVLDPPPVVGTVVQRLERKRQELAAKGLTVSMATMWRRYVGFKHGVLGCADKRGLPGHTRNSTIDPEVRAVLDKVRKGFTWKPTPSGAQVIELAARETLQLGLTPLRRSTAYKELRKLDRGQSSFGAATRRQSVATSPDRGWGTCTAVYPGQEVQIDSTSLDAWALLADGTSARIDLAVVIDVATRTIAAAILRPKAHLSVEATEMVNRAMIPLLQLPGWLDTMSIARHYLPRGSISPEEELRKLAAARPILDIRGVFVDRGRIFVVPTFVGAMESRGIHQRIASPHEPTAKPIVERVIKTIGADFVQWMRGYTGNSVANRGRSSKIEAVWPIVLLQSLLDQWILSVYQYRPHAGLDLGLAPHLKEVTPNDLYAALSAHIPGQIRTLDRDEWIGLLAFDKRTIQRYGVNMHHLTYTPQRDSPDEARLRGLARSRSRRPDGYWEVRYDPTNVMQIWVRDDERKTWIECRWKHADLVVVPFGLQLLHTMLEGYGDANRPTEKEIAQRANDIHMRLFAGPDEADLAFSHREAAAARKNLTRQVMRPKIPPDHAPIDARHVVDVEDEPPLPTRITPIRAVDYSEEW